MKLLEIGGTDDHVHVLISLPATMSIAKAMQLLKGTSSKWIHETFPIDRAFAWQEEYGAFSVSVSQLGKTQEYIQNQPERHKKMSFQEELVTLLAKHKVEYHPRYLWR